LQQQLDISTEYSSLIEAVSTVGGVDIGVYRPRSVLNPSPEDWSGPVYDLTDFEAVNALAIETFENLDKKYDVLPHSDSNFLVCMLSHDGRRVWARFYLGPHWQDKTICLKMRQYTLNIVEGEQRWVVHPKVGFLKAGADSDQGFQGNTYKDRMEGILARGGPEAKYWNDQIAEKFIATSIIPRMICWLNLRNVAVLMATPSPAFDRVNHNRQKNSVKPLAGIRVVSLSAVKTVYQRQPSLGDTPAWEMTPHNRKGHDRFIQEARQDGASFCFEDSQRRRRRYHHAGDSVALAISVH
jgi:hypothetical protein